MASSIAGSNVVFFDAACQLVDFAIRQIGLYVLCPTSNFAKRGKMRQ
jgi:hypothetical protein